MSLVIFHSGPGEGHGTGPPCPSLAPTHSQHEAHHLKRSRNHKIQENEEKSVAEGEINTASFTSLVKAAGPPPHTPHFTSISPYLQLHTTLECPKPGCTRPGHHGPRSPLTIKHNTRLGLLSHFLTSLRIPNNPQRDENSTLISSLISASLRVSPSSCVRPHLLQEFTVLLVAL